MRAAPGNGRRPARRSRVQPDDAERDLPHAASGHRRDNPAQTGDHAFQKGVHVPDVVTGPQARAGEPGVVDPVDQPGRVGARAAGPFGDRRLGLQLPDALAHQFVHGAGRVAAHDDIEAMFAHVVRGHRRTTVQRLRDPTQQAVHLGPVIAS